LRIIDGHCHIGQGLTYSQTADELLGEMDRHGVSASVIVPADRFIAVDNQEGNDLVFKAARDHPDRLIPFATANPWYGDKALEEMGRAFDLGARGLKLHPPMQGFQITDEIVFPLVELAVEHGKPIYFHTGTPICCTPFQLTELAMRYPEGTFIMGHAAYADYWNDVTASVSCVPNIYIETSQHLASFVRTLIEQVGPERIIYGSDSPLTSMALEIEKITRYVHSPEALESIFSGNIERVLGGDA
jgi:predicted TIM-barrel fold metal-dependent hydrolase